jgi:site-specific recombinase XerD
MSLELRRILWKYLGKHEHSVVFPGPRGDRLRYSGVLKMLRREGKRQGVTGVRFSPHTMRHTFALNYLRKGGSVFHLQKILGHTTLEMTRKYCNLMTEDLQAVHSKLSLLGGGACQESDGIWH